MKRRHFLSLAGGSAAGLALAHLPSLGRKLFAPGARRVRFGPGVESFVPTTCTLCPAGCGVLARVVDGHLVKLEGNPLHPINRGRLCALGQAGVHLVHNPNRIRRPQKRVGPRGTGSYAPVSWDEATQLLASKLLEAHGAGHGHSVVALDGSPGLAGRVLNRLLTALGSPNHLVDRPVDSMESAAWLTQGERMRPGYDLERARFLLSLGAPLMESWWSPVLAQRIYAQRTTESGRNRMRLVHFDTRFSSTAAVADEWYPVKPGGFQALALSFAYVVVKETLYDHEFLSRYTAGFFSEPSPLGASGLRDLLLRDCSPDKLAPQTGVAPDVVYRLAKEMAQDRPALVLSDPSVSDHPRATQTAWAVHSLNALLGNLDAPGGVIFPDEVPLTPMPPLPQGAGARASIAHERIDGGAGDQPVLLDQLASSLMSGKPYAPSVLLLHQSNPLYSAPAPERFRRALQEVPFVVSFTPYRDETLAVADLVLPESVYLERWDLVSATPSSGKTVVGIGQPVVPARHQTRASADFFLDVMRAMKEPFSACAAWKDARELVQWSIDGLIEAGRGSVFTEELEEAQLAALEERGWWFATQPDKAAFKKTLLQNGGWWDPVYQYGRWGRVFQTGSGRFEFRSSTLQQWVDEQAKQLPAGQTTSEQSRADVIASLGLGSADAGAFLPRPTAGEPPAEQLQSLTLVAYRPLTRSGAVLGQLGVLRDVLGMHLTSHPVFWVEVSPADAVALNLRPGQAVRVETPFGSLTAQVHVQVAAPKGVVTIPYGFGQSDGTFEGIGANVSTLFSGKPDPISRTGGWGPVAARLVPLEPGGQRG